MQNTKFMNKKKMIIKNKKRIINRIYKKNKKIRKRVYQSIIALMLILNILQSSSVKGITKKKVKKEGSDSNSSDDH